MISLSPLGAAIGSCALPPRNFCRPNVAQGPVIRSESEEVLLSVGFLMALALRLDQLGLSRLRTADWLAAILFSWHGQIETFEGEVIELHDEILDDAYGNDQAFTWNSAVKAFAYRPPLRRGKRSMLLRMQLFDVGFKILGQKIELPEE